MNTGGRPRHPDVLTPREWEVLTLLREGLTNPQIAERMGITLDGAKYHVSEILSKLHLGSREEAAAWKPEPPRAAVLRPSWANALGRWWPLFARAAGVGVMVAAVAGLGVLAYGLMQSEDEDAPDDATATEPTTAAFEAEVTETLNAFLEARIAGEGAQQYVDVPEEDVPLLYATTSGAPYERAEFEPVSGIEWQYDWTGAPYERAEFEPVSGIEWPSGETAFKVRLFAGDTMVEQLFFMPHDHRSPTDGHPRLTYQTDGFGTDIAPTTEDGQPLAMPYTAFDGLVTVHIAHPWVAQSPDGPIRLIPEGVGPTTDGGQRNGWERLLLVADPQPGRTFCETFPVPADAEALAEIIESDTDLETTAPEVVRVGEADALIMDVVAVAERGICNHGVPTPPEGERMRLYLFDAPEGSSMRILAIAIVVPEDRFERAVGGAAPVVASVEFHAT